MKFNSVVEAVAYYAKESPDKICIIEGETERKCTYSEFWRYIQGFAQILINNGIKQGDRVVVRVSQSIDMLVAALGTHLAGCVHVPIEKNIADYRIIEILKDTDAKYYVASEPVEYDCGYTDLGSLSDDSLITGPNDMLFEFPSLDKMSDIIYTTGTTGKSKGVMLCHNNIVSVCLVHLYTQDITSDDVSLVPQPLSRVGGYRKAQFMFLAGGTTILHNGVINAEKVYHSIKEYKVTILCLIPAFLTVLLDYLGERLTEFSDQLRSVQMGSSATSVNDQERLRKLLPMARVLNFYGGTEAGFICCLEISKYPSKSRCIGKPTRGNKILFLDEAGQEKEHTSKDDPGIIACEGPSVMLGYWNEPELTKSILKDGRIILADIGYMGDDELIHLEGRKDDVINTGGYKIAPGEIEDLVLQIEGIKECACVPITDKIMGQVPKLFVVMRDGYPFLPKKINSYLSERLESYKRPRSIEQLDELPKTEENAKILRRELIEREAKKRS